MGKQSLRMLVALASAIIFSGCAATATQAKPETQTSLSIVEQYLAALNRRDLLLLTAYVAPDVEWYSVVNGERLLEVSGREALAKILTSYFAQHSRTHWAVEQSNAAGTMLAVTERSEWDEGGAMSARTSLCVYEIFDGRIRRMTYYLAAP